MQLSDLKLWQRELALHRLGLMQPVEPTKCIVWEDPADIEAPAKVTTPSGAWLCMALMGGVLPPVEAYHTSRIEIEAESGRCYNVPLLEAPDVRTELRTRGRIKERIVRYDVHEAPVIGSLSEQDAVEYILRKDTPHRVWGQGGNRQHYLTTLRVMLPTTRIVRNSWELGDTQQPVYTNMTKARREFKVKVGREYQKRMKKYQEDAALGVLFGPDAQQRLNELQAMDLQALVRAIDKATSAEQLEQLWPWGEGNAETRYSGVGAVPGRVQ